MGKGQSQKVEMEGRWRRATAMVVRKVLLFGEKINLKNNVMTFKILKNYVCIYSVNKNGTTST